VIGPITWVGVALDSGFDAVLAAARTGAPWALAELYRDLHPAVLRYLKSQEPTEGEDIASEVWIDVAGALGRFEGHEPDFRRWVFTIARRRLIDTRRKRGRRRTDVAANERFAERAANLAHDPSTLIADRITVEEATQRHRALLPADQAEVIALRVLGGLDVNHVAEVMGKRPGTVRVLQHRALRRLAEAGWSRVVTK